MSHNPKGKMNFETQICQALSERDDFFEAISFLCEELNLALSKLNAVSENRKYEHLVDYRTFIIPTYNLDGIAQQLFSDNKECLHKIKY